MPFTSVLLITNHLIVCSRVFAFSKYLAVSKLMYNSGLSCEVFWITGLYQNHFWISFPIFYILSSSLRQWQFWQQQFSGTQGWQHLPIDLLAPQHPKQSLWEISTFLQHIWSWSSFQDTHTGKLWTMLWKSGYYLLFCSAPLEQPGSGKHLKLTSSRQLGQVVCSIFPIPGSGCDNIFHYFSHL